MPDKIPLKTIFTGADATALAEFAAGDTTPIANGGTGATTAALALAALGGSGPENTTSMGTLIAGATAKATPIDSDFFGLSDSSTTSILRSISWAQFKAALKPYFDSLYGALASLNTWSAAQRGGVAVLAVATNAVAVNLALANNFSLALQPTTGQTLSNPTNAVAGQSGQIGITQNATPSTLAFASNWKTLDGVSPVASTTAASKNILSYYVQDATTIWYSYSKGGVA